MQWGWGMGQGSGTRGRSWREGAGWKLPGEPWGVRGLGMARFTPVDFVSCCSISSKVQKMSLLSACVGPKCVPSCLGAAVNERIIFLWKPFSFPLVLGSAHLAGLRGQRSSLRCLGRGSKQPPLRESAFSAIHLMSFRRQGSGSKTRVAEGPAWLCGRDGGSEQLGRGGEWRGGVKKGGEGSNISNFSAVLGPRGALSLLLLRHSKSTAFRG